MNDSNIITKYPKNEPVRMCSNNGVPTHCDYLEINYSLVNKLKHDLEMTSIEKQDLVAENKRLINHLDQLTKSYSDLKSYLDDISNSIDILRNKEKS